MKLHNFCAVEDTGGKRGWDEVKNSLSLGPLAALEADLGHYVRDLRVCIREGLETFGPRRHGAIAQAALELRAFARRGGRS